MGNRDQIDNILVQNDFLEFCKSIKTVLEADFGSDLIRVV